MQNILYVIILTLTLLVAVFVGFFVSKSQQEKQAQIIVQDNQELAEQINVSMSQYLHSMMRLSDTLYYNIIKGNDRGQMEQMFQAMYDGYKDYVESIALFQEDGTLLQVMPALSSAASSDVMQEEWFSSALERSENIHFFRPQIQDCFEHNSSFPWVIPMSRFVQITHGNQVLSGVLLINIKYSALSEVFRKACKQLLIDSIKAQMNVGETAYEFENRQSVVLVIGVNGVGKTTSIGKLAGKLKDQGKKVILAAADTFRAAAGEQLTEWAHRAGVEIISGQEGSDPAAVVYDAIQASKARHADVLLCDTAGRLHNKKNLMAELGKINRVIDREYPEAYRETLVVLDGTTGQNALAQARQFSEIADITGIILTKLDGTAKGGIAVAIHSELGIPVKYIGVGESIDDLQKFDADEFVNALFDVKDSEEEE